MDFLTFYLLAEHVRLKKIIYQLLMLFTVHSYRLTSHIITHQA